MSDLIVVDKLKAIEVFSDDGLDPLLEKISKEVKSFVPDMTTEAGRKEIASMAYKVSRSKTALDDLGKKLVEKQKKEIGVVDASRKKMREYLDNLRDEVRKPLNDWEEKDKQRIENHKATIKTIESHGELVAENWADYELDAMQRILEQVESINVDDLDEFTVMAQQAKKQSIINVKHGISEFKAAEEKKQAEIAEAERKAEEEAKAEAERIEREKAEAAEKARKEAEEKAEREKQAAIKAEQERAEKAEREAKEAVERVEREKKEAAEKAEREKQAAIKAEQEKAEKAEAERKAKEKAEQEEKERRERNTRHRGKINRGIVVELVKADKSITVEAAKSIVKAMAQGKIPNVTINY